MKVIKQTITSNNLNRCLDKVGLLEEEFIDGNLTINNLVSMGSKSCCGASIEVKTIYKQKPVAN